MPGPLQGLVVVDASWGLPAGLASMQLADYGATVVKVERPEGDRVREANQRAILDRGKRSVTADLGTKEGRAVLHGLLARADVFLESFAPGRGAELGLDEDSLRATYPQLVHVSLTGYGTDTPWAARPGYEALLNARLGMTAEQRAHRDGPVFLGHPTVSYGTAFITVIGALAALRARKITGQGQHVGTSLLDGMLTLASMNWWWNEKDISYLARSGKTSGFGRKRLITDPFQCADGGWLIPHTGGPGSYKRMMDLMGFGDRVQAIDGPEMAVPLNDEELDVARVQLPFAFKSRPRDEWVALFAEHDLACLPVLRPEDVFEDDQVRHAGVAIDLPTPDGRVARQIGPVVRFRGTPAAVPAPARSVGADNGDVDDIAQDSRWSPSPDPSELRRALEGVKIVDFSSFFATGFASRLLVDLGAEVVKVERPIGDEMRPLGDLWEASQRGKRGVAIDIRTPEGQEIAHKLVAEADVVLVNFRPGKAEKVGLGYEQLKAINPDLVHVYLPGFGADGPKANLKSFAPLQSGLVGLNFIGAGEGNAPIRRVMGNEDLYNGFLGAVSVLMGLVSRQNSGKGQAIESPQMHSSLLVRTEHGATPEGGPFSAQQLDSDQTGFNSLYRLYRTADGWLMLAALGGRHFAALAEVLGHREWATDPRFATADDRTRNDAELGELLIAAFSELDTERVFADLDSAGVPVEIPLDHPYMPELLWDEWATETGRVIEHHHPEYGWCREVGVTIHLSETPGAVTAPSPMLGQHTREVLVELRYSDAEIDDLVARGVAVLA